MWFSFIHSAPRKVAALCRLLTRGEMESLVKVNLAGDGAWRNVAELITGSDHWWKWILYETFTNVEHLTCWLCCMIVYLDQCRAQGCSTKVLLLWLLTYRSFAGAAEVSPVEWEMSLTFFRIDAFKKKIHHWSNLLSTLMTMWSYVTVDSVHVMIDWQSENQTYLALHDCVSEEGYNYRNCRNIAIEVLILSGSFDFVSWKYGMFGNGLQRFLSLFLTSFIQWRAYH